MPLAKAIANGLLEPEECYFMTAFAEQESAEAHQEFVAQLRETRATHSPRILDAFRAKKVLALRRQWERWRNEVGPHA